MNITILSGGSGNDALVKGLKKYYPKSKINIILNAYDSGKSTGVCRKVTNTLGVSDIRKNHVRLYKQMSSCINQNILEFYDKRFDFTAGKEVQEILALLQMWDLTIFAKDVVSFFANDESFLYEFKDFNVANIVYASMYQQIGYEETNLYFENFLGIQDKIILNSFDNVYIKAKCESGYVIEDEGELVEFCNKEDPIQSLIFVGQELATINPEAIQIIKDSDFIIISSGTFWSSIFPTIVYGDFYKYLNESSAKKVWVMNNEQDKDAYGVSNIQFHTLMSKYLDMSKITTLMNYDADDILKLPIEGNTIYRSLGNTDGKHSGSLLAKECLKFYFNLNQTYDCFIFDFDDTIYSRLAKQNKEFYDISVENCLLLTSLKKEALIVSGNSYESIRSKLSSIFGSSLSTFNIDVWADANAILYHNGVPSRVAESSCIVETSDILNLLLGFGIKEDTISFRGQTNYCTSVSIKPLGELERKLLVALLNKSFEEKRIFCTAYSTGFTTVDILSSFNNKSIIFDEDSSLKGKKTYYVGDEVDEGNDKKIAKLCTSKLHVSSVEETNAFLKVLKDCL